MKSLGSLLKIAPLGLLLLAPLAFNGPATSVGPPWISVELPANPLDATSRGAALLVHTYHHADPVNYELTGSAEGLVKGERRSVALELVRTSRSGVWALAQQWPAEGSWVLTFAIGAHGQADATLVIELGPDGGIQESNYYSMPTNVITTRSIQIVAGDVEDKKIEKALKRLAATD